MTTVNCPNCGHDVTGHFAAMGDVVCGAGGCSCTDWQPAPLPPPPCPGYDLPNGESCIYAYRGHDGVCKSREQIKRARDREIARAMGKTIS